MVIQDFNGLPSIQRVASLYQNSYDLTNARVSIFYCYTLPAEKGQLDLTNSPFLCLSNPHEKQRMAGRGDKGKVTLLQRQRHENIELLERKVFERERRVEEKKAMIKEVVQDEKVVSHKLLKIAEIGGADSGTYKAEQHRLKMLGKLDTLEHSNEFVASTKNDVIGQNALLKQEINDLRHEKLVYLEAFERLGKDLERSRLEVDKQQEIVDLTYSSRDKAQVLCQSVLIEFEKRQAKLRAELAHLEEVAKAAENPDGTDEDDKELSMKEMMGLVGGKNKKNKKKTHNNGKGGRGLRDSMKRMNFSDAKKDKGRGAGKMKIQDIGYLNNLWKNIQQRTGLSTADELSTVFLQMEQIKMQKLMEASGLISQIKTIKANIRAIEKERQTFVAENKSRAKKQKDFVSGLQKRMERVEKSNDEMARKISYAHVLLRTMIRPLRKLGQCCDPGKLSERLSKVTTTAALHHTVAELNDDSAPADLLEHLAVIEQRITDILQFHQAFMQNHNPNSPKWKRKRHGPGTKSGALARRLEKQQEAIINEMVKKFSEEKSGRDFGRGGGGSEERLSRDQLFDMVSKELSASMGNSAEEKELMDLVEAEERSSRATSRGGGRGRTNTTTTSTF